MNKAEPKADVDHLRKSGGGYSSQGKGSYFGGAAEDGHWACISMLRDVSELFYLIGWNPSSRTKQNAILNSIDSYHIKAF